MTSLLRVLVVVAFVAFIIVNKMMSYLRDHEHDVRSEKIESVAVAVMMISIIVAGWMIAAGVQL